MGVAATVLVCLATAMPAAMAANGPQGTWKAGLATVVTTPQQPMWMAGYAARNKPSEGKVHDLNAKALALEDDQGTRFVIVTVDLIGFPREFRDAVEKDVLARYGLRPEALLLNASHTHSGPEIRAWRATQAWDLPAEQIELGRKYAETLQVKVVDLVGRALKDLTPAQLSYMHGRAAAAMNRRSADRTRVRYFPQCRWSGRSRCPRSAGDHARWEDDAGNSVWLCLPQHHARFLPILRRLRRLCPESISKRRIRGRLLCSCIGCGADQNPTPRRTLEWAKQHGRAVANGVEQALAAKPRPVRGPLKLALGEATLELAAPPSVEELKKQASSTNKYESRHAEELLKDLEAGRTRSTYPYLVQVARFGDDLTMVGLAGEVVVDYSLRLKKELGAPTSAGQVPAVWVAGYCNEVFGYVPSQRVLQEGGYEAKDSILYYDITVTPFTPSVEERIVDKVHELVQQVRK